MFGGFELAEIAGQAILGAQGLVGVSPVSGIPIAIMLGMLVNNSGWKMPTYFQGGLKFCTTTVLRTGIVCVGAKLSALEIASLGLVGVPVVMLSIGATMFVTSRLGDYLGLSRKMTSLIAAGTSICGVTAITAVAPVVKANQQEISFAVANVVAFGTLGMLTYPYLLPMVLTSSQQIGTVMGLAIHDTSQVMGAALTYQNIHSDDMVLKAAAVTKLTRNLFLAAVVPYFTMKFNKLEAQAIASSSVAASSPTSVTATSANSKFTDLVPMFVLGFVGMAGVRSVGDMMLAQDMLALGALDAGSWKVGFV
jgi:uncharacterized integral membrane protein (TIGR00698 family)